MSVSCCGNNSESQASRNRRVLWIVLAVNAAMFLIEVFAGFAAKSASLQADALDFLADSANYAISLLVVGMAVRYRAGAALAKGLTMGAFGVWVLGVSVLHAFQGTLPRAETMGIVGVLALLANAACMALLYAQRDDDSNMRSVWLCSRNDVIGNAAVLLAALGVFGAQAGWPDVIVAVLMGSLAIHAAWQVIRQSLTELRKKSDTERVDLRPAADP